MLENNIFRIESANCLNKKPRQLALEINLMEDQLSSIRAAKAPITQISNCSSLLTHPSKLSNKKISLLTANAQLNSDFDIARLQLVKFKICIQLGQREN